MCALLQSLQLAHPMMQASARTAVSFMPTLIIRNVILVMSEIYVSTDIESDGPIPGPNSMLSFGSVALSENGEELGCFSRNLETLPGATGDPDTMAWWGKPERKLAWEACRKDPMSPQQAMKEYVHWVENLPGTCGRPVFVAYPTGFDFTFVYWYLMNFAGESPFSFSAIDIKTFAMAVMGKPYRESVKKHMPRRWFSNKVKHTHVAIDDAREQGLLFIEMLKESRARVAGPAR